MSACNCVPFISETKPCQLNKQLLKVVPILLLLALTFPFLYFMSSDYSVFSDDSETQSSNSVSATQVVSRRGRLKILEYDSQLLFPYPNLTYPARKMLRSKWATNLKAALNSAELNKQITFLMVSFDYFSTLINWLLHAKLHAPLMLKDLLVVCLDDRSHKVLHDKGIVSSVVTVNDIVQSISDIEGPLFHARVVVRLTVLRLLNYWGYDVLQMDIDAILMKNIQPLFAHFSDVDIITSTTVANCIPKRAHRAWGFCMCVGALLIRSNEKTGACVCVCVTGTVFGNLIMGYAKNPSMKQQLFTYAILGFTISEPWGCDGVFYNYFKKKFFFLNLLNQKKFGINRQFQHDKLCRNSQLLNG